MFIFTAYNNNFIYFFLNIFRYIIRHLFQACPLRRTKSVQEEFMKDETAENIQRLIKSIKDVNGQFVEDVNVILEKCGIDPYVMMILSKIVRFQLDQFSHFCFFFLKVRNKCVFGQLCVLFLCMRYRQLI